MVTRLLLLGCCVLFLLAFSPTYCMAAEIPTQELQTLKQNTEFSNKIMKLLQENSLQYETKLQQTEQSLDESEAKLAASEARLAASEARLAETEKRLAAYEQALAKTESLLEKSNELLKKTNESSTKLLKKQEKKINALKKMNIVAGVLGIAMGALLL